MEKILKVCSVPCGRKHANGINIKGDYLKKYDFQENDFVKVSISKGRIVIEKTPQTDTLRNMGLKNPALLKFIENMDLIPA